MSIQENTTPMKVYRGIPTTEKDTVTSVAIGDFDGVHLGHQALVRGAVAAARRIGAVPCVLTFEPSSKEFFRGEKLPRRISTIRDKAEAMASHGVERLFFARFDAAMASLEAGDFVRDVLLRRLRAKAVSVGTNFTFGAGGRARSGDLVRLGTALGIEVNAARLLEEGEDSVSSTRLRAALAAGDFDEAKRLLGHPYRMTGRVMKGFRLGREIGFPTLNIRPAPPGCLAEPAVSGVFATLVHGLADEPLPGVTSVGNRPTVVGGRRFTCETNLLTRDIDAYGKVIGVEFVGKLRDNVKFPGLDALKGAISRDVAEAKRIFGLARG